MSPIEKGSEDVNGSRSLAKVMWGIVIILVGSVLLAFLLGVWSHYIVEFFGKGWDVVR